MPGMRNKALRPLRSTWLIVKSQENAPQCGCVAHVYEVRSEFVWFSAKIGKPPIVFHGLVQTNILDDHSETTHKNANFEGTHGGNVGHWCELNRSFSFSVMTYLPAIMWHVGHELYYSKSFNHILSYPITRPLSGRISIGFPTQRNTWQTTCTTTFVSWHPLRLLHVVMAVLCRILWADLIFHRKRSRH